LEDLKGVGSDLSFAFVFEDIDLRGGLEEVAGAFAFAFAFVLEDLLVGGVGLDLSLAFIFEGL
jgi:hypothetical protein